MCVCCYHCAVCTCLYVSLMAFYSCPCSAVPLTYTLFTVHANSKESARDGTMSYKEFIWFLLSEEDKTTSRRCVCVRACKHTRARAHTRTHTHCMSLHRWQLSVPGQLPLAHHLLFLHLCCPLLNSIEYWFRCLDIDGDGCLSLYEMEQFYVEMLDKMKSMGIEGLPLTDCLCQVSLILSPLPQNCC